MKNNEKLFLIGIISFICLLSISCVSAAENVSGGDLSDLDNAIKNSNDGQISLNGDIQANPEDSSYTEGIVIDKSVVIEGNNHKINLLPVSSKNNSRAFYVSGNLTLKNVEINDGHIKDMDAGGMIYVTSNGKLTLINVTFINSKSFLGSSVYSLGDVTIKDSTFKSISTDKLTAFGSVIYMNSINANLNIYNSIFKNNKYVSSIALDKSKNVEVYNCVFENNVVDRYIIDTESVQRFIVDSCIFTKNTASNVISSSMAELTLVSSLFVDNTFKNELINIGLNGSIDSNVFIGNNKNTGVLINAGANALITNNYFGVNNVTGCVVGATPKNNIQLTIVGEKDINYNNLSVADYYYVYAYLQGNTSKLPSFTMNIGTFSNKIKLNQSFILLVNDAYTKVGFLATKSGNDAIIFGNNYDVYCNVFNLTVAPITLKNYTMYVNINNITYGDILSIDVGIYDVDGNMVSGIVKIIIDNVEYNLTLLEGPGNLQISGLSAGTHNLNATYNDTTYFYNDVSIIKTFNIAKADLIPRINVYDITVGQTEVVTVSNLPLDLERNIFIVISGKGGETKVINGTAERSFSDLSSGSKGVLISYYGDTNYNPFKTTVYFYVSKQPVEPDVPIKPDPKPDPVDPKPDPKPAEPDVPVGPSGPDSPDVPVGPNPDVPVGPSGPDSPDVPVGPNPDVPVGPSGPDSPEAPVSPNVPDSPNNPSVPNENSGNNDNSHSSAADSRNNHGESDAISSNSNDAKFENAFVGSTNDDVSSQDSNPAGLQNSAKQSAEGDNSKAYEIVEKITKEINANSLTYGIIALIICVLLLFVGYRRQKGK